MPAKWVMDEDIWEEAKDAVGDPKSKYVQEPRTFTDREVGDPKYPDQSSYWSTVTHVYKQMGGRIKPSKEASTMPDLAHRLTVIAAMLDKHIASPVFRDDAAVSAVMDVLSTLSDDVKHIEKITSRWPNAMERIDRIYNSTAGLERHFKNDARMLKIVKAVYSVEVTIDILNREMKSILK